MIPALLIDTDMLTDCDDAAALAMAFEFERRGECRILGITVSSAYPASAAVVSAIADFYGRTDLPIGAPAPGEGYRRDDSCFLDKVAAEFPHRVSDNAAAGDAVRLMRGSLADEPDDSVSLVTIGYMSNVRSLLRSPADGLAPLSGCELVRRKVREWVCMGGNFPIDDARDNVNFTRDLTAAVEAIRGFPGRIVFVGREVGHTVFAGDAFHELPEIHPVRRAYELHRGRYGVRWDHHTADPCTLLYAVRGPGEFFEVESGAMNLRDDGTFEWRLVSGHSPHARILIRADRRRIADAIEDIVLGRVQNQPVRP